jgi:hypothetical protein
MLKGVAVPEARRVGRMCVLTIVMVMVVIVAMAMTLGVGAGLGQEGLLAAFELETTVLQQVGQHRIPEQAQFAGAELQGHMAVAEVVSRLQQRHRLGGPHQQQGFGGRLHPHRRIAGLPEQPLAGAQWLAPLELEQQVAAAEALAVAPQAGTVIG